MFFDNMYDHFSVRQKYLGRKVRISTKRGLNFEVLGERVGKRLQVVEMTADPGKVVIGFGFQDNVWMGFLYA